jgi:hypothetical protein
MGVMISRSTRAWYKEHAEWDEKKGGGVCKETKRPIMQKNVGRTVWDQDGDPCASTQGVVLVAHLWCSAHQEEPQIREGAPIIEGELVEFA